MVFWFQSLKDFADNLEYVPARGAGALLPLGFCYRDIWLAFQSKPDVVQYSQLVHVVKVRIQFVRLVRVVNVILSSETIWSSTLRYCILLQTLEVIRKGPSQLVRLRWFVQLVKLYLITDTWKFPAQLSARGQQPTGTTRTTRATIEIVSHHGHLKFSAQLSGKAWSTGTTHTS